MRLLSILIIYWYKKTTILHDQDDQGVYGLITGQIRHSRNGFFYSKTSESYTGNGWGMKQFKASFTHMSSTWSGQLEEYTQDLDYMSCHLGLLLARWLTTRRRNIQKKKKKKRNIQDRSFQENQAEAAWPFIV